MLTDLACRKAKAKDAAYQLHDSGGLFLYVTKAGFRSWRFKYRFHGKEKRLTFGGYPEVSLPKARELRDRAREKVRDGVDPGIDRKLRAAEAALAAENTFAAVTKAWHAAQKRLWKPRYADQVLQRFENDVFPMIGPLPTRAISAALVLQVIRVIEAREAHEMAHRVRQHISDVFVFAIASGWAEDDPAHVVRKALTPTAPRLRPAVTKLASAQRVLGKTEGQSAYAVTKLAARLLALTAARPGVIRMAAPQEFEGLDTASPIWRVPAEKMKLTRERRIDATYEFAIPLSRQAVEVVKVALELVGKDAPFLFPSTRDFHAPISDNTLSKFYRDAGLRGVHVPHGWRATFSTLMNELAADEDREEDRDIIDMMLAHVRNGVEAAYNRAAYMKRRREIAQRWADMLMAGAVAPGTLVVTQRGTSERAERRRGRDRRLASADAPPHQPARRKAGRKDPGA